MVGAARRVLALVVAFSIWELTPSRLIEPGFLAMFGAYPGMLALRYRPALSYPLRAIGFCVLLFMVGSTALYNVGLLPGTLLINVLLVVSACLFLGQRAMLVALALTTLTVVVSSLLGGPGRWPSPPDTGSILWLRLGAGYCIPCATIALLITHVVSKIEQGLLATSQALHQLSQVERERAVARDALSQTEEALLRSQKLEAVGRLAAGVGHDFNNSLQVVLSWATLLRGERDPRLLEEGLDAVEQAALQGAELTRRLLAFGRRDVRARTISSPGRMLEESAKSLRRLLPEDISIELEIEAELPTLLVDAAQIAHTLLNLGINARDAMPAGGALTLGARCIHRDPLPEALPAASKLARGVELWVRDTGCGMSAEARSHLFEPFFTTKGDRGSGLGLATSYAMVKQNGDSIQVQSEEGKGTTFCLYFPEHGAAMERALPDKPRERAKGAVVMVAEDDEDVRQCLVRALGAAGFRVLESADAASAIAVLEREGGDVDVLCTDGIMPGGGTRRLIDSYLSRRPQGRVIICSGYVQEELLRREIDAGAFGYLPKPFPPSELVERIHLVLSNPRDRAGAASN